MFYDSLEDAFRMYIILAISSRIEMPFWVNISSICPTYQTKTAETTTQPSN
jgi:hypothetical protein